VQHCLGVSNANGQKDCALSVRYKPIRHRKNNHRNYTGERNGSQMPDYISAMDIDEIVDYILEEED
jgi:hypothetical protein